MVRVRVRAMVRVTLGRGTYSSASRSNSVAKASERPTRLTAPELAWGAVGSRVR